MIPIVETRAPNAFKTNVIFFPPKHKMSTTEVDIGDQFEIVNKLISNMCEPSEFNLDEFVMYTMNPENNPVFSEITHNTGYCIARGDGIRGLETLSIAFQERNKKVKLIMIDPPYQTLVNASSDSYDDKLWSQEQWKTIIKSAFRCLDPKGTIVIFFQGHENFQGTGSDSSLLDVMRKAWKDSTLGLYWSRVEEPYKNPSTLYPNDEKRPVLEQMIRAMASSKKTFQIDEATWASLGITDFEQYHYVHVDGKYYISKPRAGMFKHFQHIWNNMSQMSTANNMQSVGEGLSKTPIYQHEIMWILHHPDTPSPNNPYDKTVGLSTIWNFYKDGQDIAVLDTIVNYQKKHHRSRFDVKPKELLRRLIAKHTTITDIVLDFAMAKGSTGAAALSLKRKFIGIEAMKEQYALCRKRLHEEFPFGLCGLHKVLSTRSKSSSDSDSVNESIDSSLSGSTSSGEYTQHSSDESVEDYETCENRKICQVCDTSQCVKKGGVFRKHRFGENTCPGSGQPPISTSAHASKKQKH